MWKVQTQCRGGRSELWVGWSDQERLLGGGGSDRKEVGSPSCHPGLFLLLSNHFLSMAGRAGMRTISVTSYQNPVQKPPEHRGPGLAM